MTRCGLLRWARAAPEPRVSGRRGGEAGRHAVDVIGKRIASRERQLGTSLQFLNAHPDLHEGPPDRLEGGAVPDGFHRRRCAEQMQQPAGAHVQEQTELVRPRAVDAVLSERV